MGNANSTTTAQLEVVPPRATPHRPRSRTALVSSSGIGLGRREEPPTSSSLRFESPFLAYVPEEEEGGGAGEEEGEDDNYLDFPDTLPLLQGPPSLASEPKLLVLGSGEGRDGPAAEQASSSSSSETFLSPPPPTTTKTSPRAAPIFVERSYPADDRRHRASYRGQMADGKRHGKGKLVWLNGSEYSGEWKNDRMDGYGVLRLPSGFKYSGEWKDGSFNGSGTVTWQSGRRYDGGWEDNRQQGAGILVYGDMDPRGREIYAGEWQNGSRSGTGMMRWKGGSRYLGSWKNGKREGFGEHTYSTGEIFRGHWTKGRRHGPGLRIDLAGCQLIGPWVNDRKHGNFFIVLPHGRIERLVFLNGRSVQGEAAGPAIVQSLLVLCIEAIAADAEVRDTIFAAGKTPHPLVSSLLTNQIRWAFDHIVLGQQKSVRLWDRVSQTFKTLATDFLPPEIPR